MLETMEMAGAPAAAGACADAGLMRAFSALCRHGGAPVAAVSPHYLVGNWAAQPLLGQLDIARVAQALQRGSGEFGRITVFDAHDPGYLIEWPAPCAPQAACADEAFDAVLPGRSRPIAATRRNAVRIARGSGHVLVAGEPGTGKRVLAEALLQRSAGACTTLDAARDADWPARFEAAVDGGRPVLLLHAAAMPAAQVADGLRLLEQAALRGVRVALTVTPNLPLALHALAARLAWRIWIPPLRDRPEDIPEIIAAWPASHRLPSRRTGAATLRWLWSRAWPGNVRELREALHGPRARPERDGARAASLPAPRVPPLVQTLQKQALVETLSRCGGNRSRAALMLGCSRATLYRKMNQFGLFEWSGT